MRYHLVPLIASSAFTFLASATSNIPQGCTHQDGWGNAVVENKCSETVYFILDNEGDLASVAPGAETSIPIYEKDADKGGMSIKLFKDKATDIWSKPAITQFEITATDLQYFDISNVNSNIGNGKNGNGEDCDKEPPFMHDGLRIQTPDGKDITCKAGQNPCNQAYSLNKDDWATAATPLGNDITLTICPDGKSSGGSKKGEGKPKKIEPEAPKQPGREEQKGKKDDKEELPKDSSEGKDDKKDTKEATHTQQNDDDDNDDDTEVVWVTQVYTAKPHVETVFVNADDHKKEKRQEHVHQHIHNKIHKRRHGA